MSAELERLALRCKGPVSIDVNDHRSCYQTTEQAIEDIEEDGEKLDPQLRAAMITLNTIVRVYFHPETPIGFHVVYHYDVTAALQRAHEILDEEAR